MGYRFEIALAAKQAAEATFPRPIISDKGGLGQSFFAATLTAAGALPF